MFQKIILRLKQQLILIKIAFFANIYALVFPIYMLYRSTCYLILKNLFYIQKLLFICKTTKKYPIDRTLNDDVDKSLEEMITNARAKTKTINKELKKTIKNPKNKNE